MIRIQNQDDHVIDTDFDNQYFFISQAYAEQEISRVRELIETGKLLSKVDDPLYNRVSFSLEMFIVNKQSGVELFLRSLNSTNEKNEKFESDLISSEVYSAIREAKKGYLRHPVAISELYTLRLRVTEFKNGAAKTPEIKEFGIYKYGDFSNALASAEYHFSWNEEPKLQSYFPEHNEYLLIELFLVEKQGEKEIQTLLQDSLNHFPLGEGLKTELEDKSSLELLARDHGHKKPSYGIKPLLWDEAPKPREYKLEDYDELVRNISVWNEIGFYYLVYWGKSWKKVKQRRTFAHHDLTRARQTAINFFDDVVRELDSSEAITLAMGSTESGNSPFVLKTTDANLHHETDIGRKEEKKILLSLDSPEIDRRANDE